MRRSLVSVLLPCLACAAGHAQDSPWFRGPNRDGTHPEARLRWDWTPSPPQVAWRREVGYGYAGATVCANRVFTAGHDKAAGRNTLWCLNAADGAVLWQTAYEDTCGGSRGGVCGPIATPIVDADRVYMVAAMGALGCFEAAGGKALWVRVTNADKDAGVPTGEYGDGAPPIVAGGLAIAHLSTARGEAAWHAFDKISGAPAWTVPIRRRQKVRRSDVVDRAYSPAFACDIAGRPSVLLISNASIECADPASGAVRWSYPLADMEIDYGPFSEPLPFDGDKFALGLWYARRDTFAAFRLKPDGLDALWGDGALGKGSYSAVVHGGHVFGCGAKGLQCLDLAGGGAKWQWRPADAKQQRDQAEIILVGDKLVWLSTSGHLYAAEAAADKAAILGSVAVFGACPRDVRADKAAYNNTVCTSPAFAAGRIFCRSAWGEMACVVPNPM